MRENVNREKELRVDKNNTEDETIDTQEPNKWAEDRFVADEPEVDLEIDQSAAKNMTTEDEVRPSNADESVWMFEIESLKAQLEAEQAKYLRLQADAQNQERHHYHRLKEANKLAIEKLVNDLLPVVDSLERGIESCEDGDLAIAQEGMNLTLKMLLDTLQRFDVVAIEPLHERFDPAQHEAISMQAHAELEANTVLAVIQKGYKIDTKILRPAMVIVTCA